MSTTIYTLCTVASSISQNACNDFEYLHFFPIIRFPFKQHNSEINNKNRKVRINIDCIFDYIE